MLSNSEINSFLAQHPVFMNGLENFIQTRMEAQERFDEIGDGDEEYTREIVFCKNILQTTADESIFFLNVLHNLRSIFQYGQGLQDALHILGFISEHMPESDQTLEQSGTVQYLLRQYHDLQNYRRWERVVFNLA